MEARRPDLQVPHRPRAAGAARGASAGGRGGKDPADPARSLGTDDRSGRGRAFLLLWIARAHRAVGRLSAHHVPDLWRRPAGQGACILVQECQPHLPRFPEDNRCAQRRGHRGDHGRHYQCRAAGRRQRVDAVGGHGTQCPGRAALRRHVGRDYPPHDRRSRPCCLSR